MLTLFLSVMTVHFIALMSPGPDFFFVSQTAVSRSRKEAMLGVLGITAGVMVWAAVALLGLNLILAKMAWLHSIIMVGGGLYLCWMGFQMLRGALKKETANSDAPQVELAAGGRSFVKGLLTAAGNALGSGGGAGRKAAHQRAAPGASPRQFTGWLRQRQYRRRQPVSAEPYRIWAVDPERG